MERIVLVLIVLLAPSISIAARLVPHTDLTYLGAFKMPSSVESNVCYQWNGIQGFILFNPDGDSGGAADGYTGSLIVSAKIGCPTIGEIDIPAPVVGDKSSLSSSSILQAITDMSNGDLQDVVSGNTNIGMGNAIILPSSGGNRIFGVTHKNYNTDNTSNWDEVLTSFSLDFATTLDHSGWFQVTGEYVGAVGQYAFTVPQAWADTNTGGKTVIVGGNRFAGGGSHGVSLYAIDPWGPTENPPVDGTDFVPTTIVEYTDGITSMDNYGYANQPGNLKWIEDSTGNASVIANGLYFGRWRSPNDTLTSDWTQNPTGWYYGTPHPEGTGGKGYNNEPYAFAFLLYDPDDLADSLDGTIESYEVQPYGYYNWAKYAYDEPYHVDGNPKNSGGLAYDETNHLLYVNERLVGEAGIIHVFSVADGSGALDTTVPTTPSNLALGTVTESTIALTWTGSTDTETDVTYLINLNGYPTVRTTDTSYVYGSTGNFVADWRAGDEGADGYDAITEFSFTVTAVDDYFNESTESNTVSYDYANRNTGSMFIRTGNTFIGTGIIQ